MSSINPTAPGPSPDAAPPADINSTQPALLEQTHSLQQTIKLLQAVMDGATDAIFLKDLHGRFLLFNQAAGQIMSRRPQDVVGRTTAETYGDATARWIRERELAVLTSGESRTTEESFVLDGRERTFLNTRSPYRDEHGNIIGLIGIARDITDLKRVERQLRQAKDKAEAAERAKADFLATMSHEIRTPMNAIIGMTRLTLSTELSIRQRNYLEKVDAAAGALLNIINDILDFSKIEAGGLHLEHTGFQLGDVLASVRDVTGLKAETKGLQMNFEVAPEVPRILRGDPLRLGQILINLVDNAVKFTDHGTVSLRVRALALQGSHTTLQFSVEDTGIGLDPGRIDDLFHAFTQLRPDTSRLYGGTGLGLAICRQLVELMGGRIWANGEPGHGSIFHFTVDLQVGDDTLTPPATPQPAPGLEPGLEAPQTAPAATVRGLRIPPGCRRHLANQRVLVVDDNALNRAVVGDLLRAVGMRVDMARSGLDALHRLAQQRPDCVLLDLHMPEMDGLATVAEIRRLEDLRNLPVISLTALATAEDRAQSLAAGMNAHLTKPVDEALLYTTLMQLLPAPQTPAPAAFSLARLGSDPPRLQQLLGDLLQETASTTAWIEEHVAAGRLTAAADAVHAVRGPAYYLDAHAVLETAAALEQVLRTPGAQVTLANLDPFRAALDELRRQLRHHVDELQAWEMEGPV